MYSVFRNSTECQFRESNPCRLLPVCGHFTMTVIHRKEEELHGFNVFTQVKVKTSLYLLLVDSSWSVMAHGDAREGKWRGNWRMEWVASTIHTTSEHGVPSITTADEHTSAASSRLNWRPSADLNGLVRFAERRNLFSVRVSSHLNRPLAACTHTPSCLGLRLSLSSILMHFFMRFDGRCSAVDRTYLLSA